jgi:hypothetical protein
MNLTAAHAREPALPIKPAITEYVRIDPSIFVLKDIAHTQAVANIVTMYSYDLAKRSSSTPLSNSFMNELSLKMGTMGTPS